MSWLIIQSDWRNNARTSGQITSSFPRHKQVGAYIRWDNLWFARVQPPTSLQRLFKQVIWGDILQLIPPIQNHGKVREERQKREDRQERPEKQEEHGWRLNFTFQDTCVGRLSRFLQCHRCITISRRALICLSHCVTNWMIFSESIHASPFLWLDIYSFWS